MTISNFNFQFFHLRLPVNLQLNYIPAKGDEAIVGQEGCKHIYNAAVGGSPHINIDYCHIECKYMFVQCVCVCERVCMVGHIFPCAYIFNLVFHQGEK